MRNCHGLLLVTLLSLDALAAPIDCDVRDRSTVAPTNSANQNGPGKETLTSLRVVGSTFKSKALNDNRYAIKVGRYVDLVQIQLTKVNGDETLVMTQAPAKNFAVLDLTVKEPDIWVLCHTPEQNKQGNKSAP